MYAILRHAKIKSTTKGVASAHNHRTSSLEQPNIDTSISHLNQYSSRSDEGFVKKLNEKLPEKRRKDAVEAVEIVLTASPEFFDAMEPNREFLAKNETFIAWKNANVAYLKKEFGDNLIDLALHLDEKTPHFHAIVIPMIGTRLCGKEVMARKELIRRQDEYAGAMAPFGLSRGLSAELTQRKHTTLKNDRRGAQKLTKLPPAPVKSGLLDIGYVSRLEQYARDVSKTAATLIEQHHRLDTMLAELQGQHEAMQAREGAASAIEHRHFVTNAEASSREKAHAAQVIALQERVAFLERQLKREQEKVMQHKVAAALANPKPEHQNQRDDFTR